MLEDAVSGNAASVWYRIHIPFCEFSPNRPFSPGATVGRKRLQLFGTQHATGRIPDCGVFSAVNGERIREKIDLPRVGFPSGLLLPTLLLPDIAR